MARTPTPVLDVDCRVLIPAEVYRVARRVAMAAGVTDTKAAVVRYVVVQWSQQKEHADVCTTSRKRA